MDIIKNQQIPLSVKTINILKQLTSNSNSAYAVQTAINNFLKMSESRELKEIPSLNPEDFIDHIQAPLTENMVTAVKGYTGIGSASKALQTAIFTFIKIKKSGDKQNEKD